MTRIGRVVRGLVGSAIIWAAISPVVRVTVGAVYSIFVGPVPPREMWSALLARAVIDGALTGVVFGGALAFLGRRRTLATIGARRVAVIGAITGGIIPASWIAYLAWHFATGPGKHGPFPVLGAATAVVINCAIGAALASTVLRMGRRAPDVAALDDSDSLTLASSTADNIKPYSVSPRELVER